MVERLQAGSQGVIFVDLDGTLISANSMHIFMRQLPRELLRKGAVGGCLAALWWMGLRTARLVSHRTMKWHLTTLAARRYDAGDWERLAEKLTLHINPEVTGYIEDARRKGCRVYIATAAPEEYALPLSRLLGYDGAIATHLSGKLADYAETRGAAKLNAIRKLQELEGLHLETFITDHEDDLPTIEAYPGHTLLVNPSKQLSPAGNRKQKN